MYIKPYWSVRLLGGSTKFNWWWIGGSEPDALGTQGHTLCSTAVVGCIESEYLGEWTHEESVFLFIGLNLVPFLSTWFERRLTRFSSFQVLGVTSGCEKHEQDASLSLGSSAWLYCWGTSPSLPGRFAPGVKIHTDGTVAGMYYLRQSTRSSGTQVVPAVQPMSRHRGSPVSSIWRLKPNDSEYCIIHFVQTEAVRNPSLGCWGICLSCCICDRIMELMKFVSF